MRRGRSMLKRSQAVRRFRGTDISSVGAALLLLSATGMLSCSHVQSSRILFPFVDAMRCDRHSSYGRRTADLFEDWL